MIEAMPVEVAPKPVELGQLAATPLRSQQVLGQIESFVHPGSLLAWRLESGQLSGRIAAPFPSQIH